MKVEYTQREYPMFSACGLNCGLCPRYQMEGASQCPGCAGKGFSAQHPKCGVLSCSQRKGVAYCFQCAEYPCKRYDGADKADSFITHLHQLKDLEKAKAVGMENYRIQLDEKIKLLEYLLAQYNDGRKKSFYCVAVNLLELTDIQDVLQQIENTPIKQAPAKEKAAAVADLLREKAAARNISLQLRK